MKKAENNKNSQKKKTNTMISTDNEMTKLIFLVLIVAAVFGIFYIITLFITKKEEQKTNNNDEQNYEATIQYDKILVSNILNQSPSEYYVLVYFRDDQYTELYKSYFMNYDINKGENAVPYYYVDINEIFNSNFIGEQSKLSVNKASDFKFKQTTLLRIQGGKVISTYEGKDSITAKFGRMIK